MALKGPPLSTVAERLAEADACHDSEPRRAAQLLSGIDPAALADGERPLFAFLLKHVLGEKLGDGGQARQRMNGLPAAAFEVPADDAESAATAAEGLALLVRRDTAGEENIDRAFLELEHAHALRRVRAPMRWLRPSVMRH